MQAIHDTHAQPVTLDPRRWGRDVYGICVSIRPQDASLLAGLQAAQAQLGLPDLAATARCLVGLAGLDVLPRPPEEAGRLTGRFSREMIEKRQAHLMEQTGRRERPSRQHSDHRKISAVLDPALFAPVAIRESSRRKCSKSDAARELLQHGLDLLAAGGPRVEAFLTAHAAALAGIEATT
jgi:hypothetical protein